MEKGKCGDQSERHVQCLAELPITFLSEQGDRFAGMCDQPVILNSYRDLFFTSVWVYPLHAYIALLRKQLGAEVADAVWSRQRAMFDEIDTGVSQSIDAAFMLIDSALDPGRVGSDESEDSVEVAPETRVALALLLGMPESPDYASGMDERSERIRTMQTEAEGCLARSLVRAREALLDACSELFPHDQTDR